MTQSAWCSPRWCWTWRCALGRNPKPYLLAVAMASNVGSTATITGNPQNIMIGSFSRIPYAHFASPSGRWRWRDWRSPWPWWRCSTAPSSPGAAI